MEHQTQFNHFSVEELEQLLQERKQLANKEREAQRKAYERKRELLINDLVETAVKLSEQLSELKGRAFMQLSEFREDMLEYGELRGKDKNKGSFSIQNEHYKIVFRHQVIKGFDERAELAEHKLKEFLSSFVKKKDRNAYKLVMGLLERNAKTGDFDVNLINRLYKMRNDFNNPLWHEALDMFQESYSPNNTAQYIQFYKRTPDTNNYQQVLLDFAKNRMPSKKVAE